MRWPLSIALFAPLALRAQTVRVTGVAFDSLALAPMPGAFITLASRSAITDSAGRFAFDSVAPGRYRLVMQHDLLDSLGLSGIAASVDVRSSMETIRIATPSAQSMWRRVCHGEQPRDSGFVFGVVLDAAKRPVSGAAVVGTWLELKQVGDTISQKGWQLDTQTQADGSFVMCGMPVGTGVALEAGKDSSLYAEVDVMLTDRTPVRRQDFTVFDPRDTLLRGTIRGVVSADGKPVENVHVETDGLPEVTTGRDGQFTLRGVRPGTRQVYFQAIGFMPFSRIVEVSVNDTARLPVTVEKAVMLDAVLVKAATARGRLIDQFNERRRVGMGKFRDSTQIGMFNALEGVFSGMPMVWTQRPGAGEFEIRIGGSRGRGLRQSVGCSAAIIIDRVKADGFQLTALRPQDIAALEVYRMNEMPMDLATQFGYNPFARPCAVVVWTKRGWR